MKFLFLCGNANHARMFGTLRGALSERGIGELVFLSLDDLKREGASRALGDIGIMPTEFGSFGILSAEEVLREIRPNILVVGNDFSPTESAFVLAARKLAVPTVLVQDGFIESPYKDGRVLARRLFPYLLRFPRYVYNYIFHIRALADASGFAAALRGSMRDISARLRATHAYGSGGCDAVAVMGEQARDYFHSIGISLDRIYITGKLPDVSQPPRESVELMRDKFAGKGERLVVFASTNLEDIGLGGRERADVMEMLASSAGCADSLSLVIKLHPLENVDWHRQMLDGRKNVVVTRDDPIYPLVCAADLVVTEISTVGFEAGRLGIPVAAITLFAGRRADALIRAGAWEVKSGEGLSKLLTRLATDREGLRADFENMNRFSSVIAKTERKASENVAELLVLKARGTR